MKRFCCVLAAVLFAAAFLCCCGKAPKRPNTIELIVKGTETEFWNSVFEGAKAAAQACGAQVTLYGPAVEEDYADQLAVMQQAIARKPSAIVLAAADYELMARPVQDALEAGIPVVMVDSDVANEGTVAYVGTNNEAMGSMLAQQLCARTPSGGRVGVISFVKESYPAVLRESGFRNAMAQNTSFSLLETAYCYSDTNRAEQLVAQMVQHNPDMVAVAALNAQSAEGAAKALSRLGREDIALFAIDCTPEEATYLEEGVLTLALLQNPYQMGYYSVETACRYLAGESVQDRYTDIYPVDAAMMFEDFYEQLIFPFTS